MIAFVTLLLALGSTPDTVRYCLGPTRGELKVVTFFAVTWASFAVFGLGVGQ